VEGRKYTINYRIVSLSSFLLRAVLEELGREGDNPTQYVGALLGSRSRRSTSITSLDQSRERR
jgi:hypothetical protein